MAADSEFCFAVIRFIVTAPLNWSFLRLGTHCSDNFFGFARQNSPVDDRSITTYRIIAKTTCACLEMHYLYISITRQGLDNVGGMVTGGEPIDLTHYMKLAADQLCQFFVALTGLNLEDTVLPSTRKMFRIVLDQWTESDKHHDKDRAYNVYYIDTIANARITFRTFRTGSRGE
jgi:hypothetical protein